MMMSQILKSIDFTETQKPEYLENKTFFLQIKKPLITNQGTTLWQKNTIVAEVAFKK